MGGTNAKGRTAYTTPSMQTPRQPGADPGIPAGRQGGTHAHTHARTYAIKQISAKAPAAGRRPEIET